MASRPDQPHRPDRPDPEPPARRRSRRRLGGALVAMGLLHVVAPKRFEAMIRKALGAPRFWNLLGATAEGSSGALLLSARPERRRLGGALATATMVGVFPANIKMALEAGPPTRSVNAAGMWLRLPLQVPLVAWTWRHASGPSASEAAAASH